MKSLQIRVMPYIKIMAQKTGFCRWSYDGWADPILRTFKNLCASKFSQYLSKVQSRSIVSVRFPINSRVFMNISKIYFSFVRTRVCLVKISVVKEASILQLDADYVSQTTHSDYLYNIFWELMMTTMTKFPLGNIYAVIQ